MGTSFSVAGRGLLIAGFLVAGRANAQGSPAPTVETTRSYRLTWAAPAACPSERELTSRIVRLLATSTLEQSALEVSVSARVEPNPDGRFRGQIEMAVDGASSLRTLDATSCDAVASATALIVATVIDPAAVERAQAADDAASAPANEAPVPRERAPRATNNFEYTGPEPPTYRSPPRTPIAWSVAALTWGGVALLPNFAWGLGLALTARQDSFTAGLDLQYWGSQRQVSTNSATAGADFERISGVARGCFMLLRSRAVVDSCVGLEVIVLRGQGFGVTDERLGVHTWFAPMLGGGVGFGLTSTLSVVGRYEVSIPLFSGHYFDIEGIGFVYQLPPIGGRAGLGIELAF